MENLVTVDVLNFSCLNVPIRIYRAKRIGHREKDIFISMNQFTLLVKGSIELFS